MGDFISKNKIAIMFGSIFLLLIVGGIISSM